MDITRALVITCEFPGRPADDQIRNKQARRQDRREDQEHQHGVPVVETVARIVVRTAEPRQTGVRKLVDAMHHIGHDATSSSSFAGLILPCR